MSVSVNTPKKEKANKVAKVIDYSVNVLGSNRKYKETIHKSFGGVRSIILSVQQEIELSPKFAKLLKDSKASTPQGKAIYQFLVDNVRVSKLKNGERGNYGVFFTLQSMAKIFNTKELSDKLSALYGEIASAK